MSRATPMSPEDRRAAIIAATIPLLREHGRATTTKQVAEAAGIAEGTIFRVFETKHELFLCAIEAVFDPWEFIEKIEALDPTPPLREKLLTLVRLMQHRFTALFELMLTMGMVQPPRSAKQGVDWRERGNQAGIRLIEANADEITVSSRELIHLVRLLTFSGSHPHVSEGRPLTPEQIVGVVLDGVLKEER